MTSQSPEDRDYEMRLKYQRDQQARLLGAYQEGFAEGLAEARAKRFEKARLFGRAQLLQELLSETPSSNAELESKSAAELAASLRICYRVFAAARDDPSPGSFVPAHIRLRPISHQR